MAAHWDVAGSGRGAALDGAAVRGGNAVPDGPWPRGEVEVPAGPVRQSGRLALPTAPRGIVILVRGAGRHDPRAQGFADALLGRVLGALLLDLLADGERTPHNVHDIVLLARRLRAASQWLRRVTPLPMAYFGMGTGAAAALAAMKTPTLFVVGELDTWLLGRTRLAADWMRCEHRLAVVPGATPAFTGPRVLDTATALGLDWFTDRLLQPVSGMPRPGAV
ncbi:alpha/beta hydrolase [Streptomyces bobili]|uniref:alpha/beta hydrolase n=1 Tax=Streptomyces bobili TaxID=67280 RepID=UPI0036E2D082